MLSASEAENKHLRALTILETEKKGMERSNQPTELASCARLGTKKRLF